MVYPKVPPHKRAAAKKRASSVTAGAAARPGRIAQDNIVHLCRHAASRVMDAIVDAETGGATRKSSQTPYAPPRRPTGDLRHYTTTSSTSFGTAANSAYAHDSLRTLYPDYLRPRGARVELYHEEGPSQVEVGGPRGVRSEEVEGDALQRSGAYYADTLVEQVENSSQQAVVVLQAEQRDVVPHNNEEVISSGVNIIKNAIPLVEAVAQGRPRTNCNSDMAIVNTSTPSPVVGAERTTAAAVARSEQVGEQVQALTQRTEQEEMAGASSRAAVPGDPLERSARTATSATRLSSPPEDPGYLMLPGRRSRSFASSPRSPADSAATNALDHYLKEGAYMRSFGSLGRPQSSPQTLHNYGLPSYQTLHQNARLADGPKPSFRPGGARSPDYFGPPPKTRTIRGYIRDKNELLQEVVDLRFVNEELSKQIAVSLRDKHEAVENWQKAAGDAVAQRQKAEQCEYALQVREKELAHTQALQAETKRRLDRMDEDCRRLEAKNLEYVQDLRLIERNNDAAGRLSELRNEKLRLEEKFGVSETERLKLKQDLQKSEEKLHTAERAARNLVEKVRQLEKERMRLQKEALVRQENVQEMEGIYQQKDNTYHTQLASKQAQLDHVILEFENFKRRLSDYILRSRRVQSSPLVTLRTIEEMCFVEESFPVGYDIEGAAEQNASAKYKN
ncbi:unnamed protein product [Amoebophrya sp. A120]|nr:unnamed protein product [Amoebophrya sp. A120]|eukprot:GSA120T00004261001.1